MTEFEEIYRTYFGDVFRYILRLSNDAHIAEEITSEVFYKAIQSIDSFRGECDLRVWLCQIAKNSYFTYRKKAGKAESLDEAPGQASVSEESAEDRLIKRDETVRIRRILHDLAEPYKEVFMWRVFADLSFKQIGELYHKTDNWACVTYHRARKMIKSRLEEQDHEK